MSMKTFAEPRAQCWALGTARQTPTLRPPSPTPGVQTQTPRVSGTTSPAPEEGGAVEGDERGGRGPSRVPVRLLGTPWSGAGRGGWRSALGERSPLPGTEPPAPPLLPWTFHLGFSALNTGLCLPCWKGLGVGLCVRVCARARARACPQPLGQEVTAKAAWSLASQTRSPPGASSSLAVPGLLQRRLLGLKCR